jgi:hypothetical protein
MNETKQQRFNRKMKEKGFKRLQVWVPEELEPQVKTYVEKLIQATEYVERITGES